MRVEGPPATTENLTAIITFIRKESKARDTRHTHLDGPDAAAVDEGNNIKQNKEEGCWLKMKIAIYKV